MGRRGCAAPWHKSGAAEVRRHRQDQTIRIRALQDELVPRADIDVQLRRAGMGPGVDVPADLGAVEFADENGAPLPAQLLAEGEGRRTYLVSVPEVGAMGYQTLTVGQAGGPPEGSTVRAGDNVLENDFVRVTLDEAGEIVSLIHKVVGDDEDDITEREVIAPGQRDTSRTLGFRIALRTLGDFGSARDTSRDLGASRPAAGTSFRLIGGR